MPDVQLKIYPRGFLGATLGKQYRHKSQLQEDAAGFHTSKIAQIADLNSVNDPNPEIEALYAKAVLQPTATGDFAFRKRIFVVALAAFGPLTFSAWYRAQMDNRFAGEMHGRFLNDCVRFLNKGNREMSLATWTQLLSIGNGTEKMAPPNESTAAFFGWDHNGQTRTPRAVTVEETVRMWCMQPQGLEDLLGSLHVLFGTGAN